MNAYYTNTRTTGDSIGQATTARLENHRHLEVEHVRTNNAVGSNSGPSSNTIGTGLLPAALGIGAKTRQNDLDIAFQFTFFTGTSAGDGSLGGLSNAAAGRNTLNIRQAYMTFGDASWGQIKMGRDLGIFGSDAILSDMTLLGVGVGGPSGGSSTLGRIGSGYIYADWMGQIQYQTPNWNGFQATVAVREPFSNGASTARHDMGFDGKVTYDFAANDVTGRVWLGGVSQKHAAGSVTFNGTVTDDNITLPVSTSYDIAGYTSEGFDLGGKVGYQGAELVGYYYDGRGLDSQFTGIVDFPDFNRHFIITESTRLMGVFKTLF